MEKTGDPVIQTIIVIIVAVAVVYFFVWGFWLSPKPTDDAIGD